MNENVPSGLRKDGKRLWSDITGEYDLRFDELAVLEEACCEIDLIKSLQREFKKADSFTVKGSMGQEVAHPLISEIRQHRNSLAALLRQLKLPDEAKSDGNQQRDAANSRWAAAYGKGA